MRIGAGIVLAFSIWLALGAIAQAQSYPSRPVTVVVPFPPGGGTDAVARVLINGMSEELGKPVVIENRPGAAGVTGMLAVSRAPGDGYTLAITNNPPLTMTMFLQKDFPYDSVQAFAPISRLADTVILLAVNASLPVKSAPELIAYAKAHPHTLSYGTPGVGTSMHIAGEMMKLQGGFDMVHVPYRGTGPMAQDLMGGQIQVGFGTPTELVPFAESGAIRLLALVESQRSKAFPELPTVAETLPGVVTKTWTGFFAPAQTPQAIVDRLNDAVVATLKRPEVAAKLRQQGWYPVGSTPNDLLKLVKDEREFWRAAIASVGLKPE
jgi:tripartite-type tricarboxylate transporter receptor subunit TctC